MNIPIMQPDDREIIDLTVFVKSSSSTLFSVLEENTNNLLLIKYC